MSGRPESRAGAWRGRRVLVTGGAGFIGSHLVEALAAGGARVTVADSLRDGRWSNLGAARARVACRRLDVRDARAVGALVRALRPAAVFHLAANASVPGSVDDPAYDFQANAAGTFAVLDALRLHAPRARMVLASSGAVYGEPGRRPVAEDAALAPISPYGAGKVCAETECRLFASLYGVPVAIARIFNSYGPRLPRFVVLDFLRKLARDPSRLEILGDGRQVRDFTYVTDTVAGLLAIAARGRPGEAYNVATGRSVSVRELARVLLGVLGLGGRTRLSFTGASWAGDARHWRVDVAKLRGLGWRPSVGLEEGLARVARWFGDGRSVPWPEGAGEGRAPRGRA